MGAVQDSLIPAIHARRSLIITHHKKYNMNNYITDTDTRIGTLTGTLLVVLCKIDADQLLSTVIVAGSGAIVSFIVSATCRFLWNRIRGK
jgi:hypothetical protein